MKSRKKNIHKIPFLVFAASVWTARWIGKQILDTNQILKLFLFVFVCSNYFFVSFKFSRKKNNNF